MLKAIQPSPLAGEGRISQQIKMSLEIWVKGNNNFSFSLFYVLSFVSLCYQRNQKKVPKKIKKIRIVFYVFTVFHTVQSFFFFGFAESFFASQTPYGQTVLGFSGHFCNFNTNKFILNSKHRKNSSHLFPCNTILIVLHDLLYICFS